MTVNINLDISAADCQKTVYINADTSLIHELCGALYDGGTPYSSTDPTYAVFKGLRDDGELIYRPAEVDTETTESTLVSYTLRRTDVAGARRIMCCFYIYDSGGTVLCTPKFLVCVEAALGGSIEDGAVVQSEDFGALTEALATVAAISEWRDDIGVTDNIDTDTESLSRRHRFWWVTGDGTTDHPGGRVYRLDDDGETITDITAGMGLERASAQEIIDALGIE